jgi:histidine ammonia-lyase
MATKDIFYLDGESLLPEDALEVALNWERFQITLTDEAWAGIDRSRKVIDGILESKVVKYGINTGFGMFATVVIDPTQLQLLQENLIESHAAGVGQPLSIAKTRMLMILRINVLAKGHSGVTRETLGKYIDALNSNCLPSVPEKGTVGASGDLAPLAHLALGLLGKGDMWNPTTKAWEDASKVLKEHGLSPLELKAKEGLALINGTQLICAFGVEALVRATKLLEASNIVVALTLEALQGTRVAYREDIHKARPHVGQGYIAQKLRQLLDSERFHSEIYHSHLNCPKVQDAYTLRCVPQVHGVVYDTLEFVRRILTTEINSATDNPMVFPETREVVSGGNFHGEYPAKVLDYLAIARHQNATK